jgi:hypothetical protein
LPPRPRRRGATRYDKFLAKFLGFVKNCRYRSLHQMIKSSPSNLGNAVEDTGDYRLFRLLAENQQQGILRPLQQISDKGRHHRCKQLESKKAAK